MDRLEFLPAALVENADEIDRGVDAGECGANVRLARYIGFERGDLADIAHRAQEPGVIGVPAGRGDDEPALAEAPDDIAPEKPRGAEHGDVPDLHAAAPHGVTQPQQELAREVKRGAPRRNFG